MPTQKKLRTIIALWIAISVFIASETLAHHGAVTNGALYLTDDFIELDGELTEVFWRNPHTRARLSVVGVDGEETIWELELGPTPRGFEGREIFADDFIGRVKAAGYRSRRNPESLGVVHLLLPTGQEYAQGNREPRWSNTRVANAGFGLESANVAEAERSADGIFRVWSFQRHPPPEYTHLLTSRGRELADEYDPVTDNPELDCRQGMPKTMSDPPPMQIINGNGQIIIRQQEYDIERIIYMNDQKSAQPHPSPLGYSVGRWEEDVLIVDTTHIGWPYIDQHGTPQSSQASYRETFAVLNEGNLLSYSITITDPVMFTAPFTMEWTRRWRPGVELKSYDCVAEWGESTQ